LERQFARKIRAADCQRRLAERAGQSDEVLVKGIELIKSHIAAQRRRQMDRILRLHVLVPDKVASSLGNESVNFSDDDPRVPKKCLDLLGVLRSDPFVRLTLEPQDFWNGQR